MATPESYGKALILLVDLLLRSHRRNPQDNLDKLDKLDKKDKLDRKLCPPSSG